MTQRSLNHFFRKTVPESSESDEDLLDVNTVSGDVSHYQRILSNREEVRKVAKIVLNCKGVTFSQCWDYFGALYIGKKNMLPKLKFCKVCFDDKNLVLKGTTTSTSNYISHLRNSHNIEVKGCNDVKKKILTKNALCSPSKKNNKFENSRMLAEMCCIDLQPFSIVARSGFKKYMKQIGQKELPCISTVSSTALNDVYTFYKTAVKDILKTSPQKISLVLDLWTDKYKKVSYINMKAHYCENFEMQCISLTTERFPHPHTGVAVAEKIKNILEEFGLNHKHLMAVTDGGANIVSAIKSSKIIRFGCSAHALHRFLSHDVLNNPKFNSLLEIITKLKKIYRTLTYSIEELIEIQQIQQQDELFKLLLSSQDIISCSDADEQYVSTINKLEESVLAALVSPTLPSIKNSVETRWNTLLVMIRSFSKNIRTINIALLNAKKDIFTIDEKERQLIEEFAKFLEIFEQATMYLQGKSYPTIAMCIYFAENIMQSLETVKNESSLKLLSDLCKYAQQNFLKRYKILKVHVISSLMDPCQKNWATLDKYIKKIPKYCQTPLDFSLQSVQQICHTRESLIYDEIKRNEFLLDDLNSSSTSNNHVSKKMKLSDTRKQMLEFLEQSSNTYKDPLETEIKQYFEKHVTEVESIDWWKENNRIFPRVAKLADICFGIPATSASSEQAFSMAGSCITEKRSRLNPATAKRQLFVHDNRAIVDQFLNINT